MHGASLLIVATTPWGNNYERRCRLLFESLLLLDEPFYRTRERDCKNLLLRVVGVRLALI
jgi:hypothetical protein